MPGTQKCAKTSPEEADGLYMFVWFVAEECIRTFAKVCEKKQTGLRYNKVPHVPRYGLWMYQQDGVNMPGGRSHSSLF